MHHHNRPSRGNQSNGEDEEEIEIPLYDLDLDCPVPHRERRGTQRTQKPTEDTEGAESAGERREPRSTQTTTLPEQLLRSPALSAGQATKPTGLGDYRKKLFAYARELKADPALADAEPCDLRPLVERWVELAGDAIDIPLDEVLIDFYAAWSKVKYPAGTGPLYDLLERARRLPYPRVADRYAQDKLRLLVALCRELQGEAGPKGTWFLSCRTAGQLLGVDHKSVWRWLFLLIQERVIERTSIGSKRTGQASEYRFLGQ